MEKRDTRNCRYSKVTNLAEQRTSTLVDVRQGNPQSPSDANLPYLTVRTHALLYTGTKV